MRVCGGGRGRYACVCVCGWEGEGERGVHVYSISSVWLLMAFCIYSSHLNHLDSHWSLNKLLGGTVDKLALLHAREGVS